MLEQRTFIIETRAKNTTVTFFSSQSDQKVLKVKNCPVEKSLPQSV